MIEILGWVATSVFVASYFFKKPLALRAVQFIGSSIWIVYGSLINALPVVVANALVCSAAAWTAWRARSGAPISGGHH